MSSFVANKISTESDNSIDNYKTPDVSHIKYNTDLDIYNSKSDCDENNDINILDDSISFSKPVIDDIFTTPINEISIDDTIEEDDITKRQRELEESEKLAWELLQQENESAYQLQMNYMRDNQNNMSAEDFMALQAIMNETYSEVVNNPQESIEDSNIDEDEENWDYDQLLTLGETIGDVKTERWRLRAAKVIDSLPTFNYQDIQLSLDSNNNNDTVSEIRSLSLQFNPRCVVCLDPFEGDVFVKVLQCKHFLHKDCMTGWLQDHNSCPICKSKASITP